MKKSDNPLSKARLENFAISIGPDRFFAESLPIIIFLNASKTSEVSFMVSLILFETASKNPYVTVIIGEYTALQQGG